VELRRLRAGKYPGISRAPCGAPRLSVALARLVDLKAVLLAETRARGPDGSRMRSPQLARSVLARSVDGARATSSVDGWASMALRSDVVVI
jgi:hypothetical protein